MKSKFLKKLLSPCSWEQRYAVLPRAAAELIQENRRRLRQKKVLGYRLKQKIRMPDRSLLQEKKQMRRQERAAHWLLTFLVREYAGRSPGDPGTDR